MWLAGRPRWAITSWLVGNGLIGFYGATAVGWDLVELADSRRSAADDERPQTTDRELAPNIRLSRATKISFVVAVTLILVIAVGVHVIQALV